MVEKSFSLIDKIISRRSIRSFKSDMIPEEDIEKIIEAGTYAPNGRGLQSPIIVAVTNKEFRDKLEKINREIGGFPDDVNPFYNGSVVLIVLADKSVPTYIYDVRFQCCVVVLSQIVFYEDLHHKFDINSQYN